MYIYLSPPGHICIGTDPVPGASWEAPLPAIGALLKRVVNKFLDVKQGVHELFWLLTSFFSTFPSGVSKSG